VGAGLVTLAVFVRIVFAQRIPASWIMSDEFIYVDLAERSTKQQILFRGQALVLPEHLPNPDLTGLDRGCGDRDPRLAGDPPRMNTESG
jgi:hypothetical protein